MTKQLFVFIVLLCSPVFFAQEMMVLKDGKQVPATPQWEFICENYALTGTASIQIAKTAKGGLLKISVETTNADFFIGGVTYAYLDDQTAIVCTDKGLRENDGNTMTAWYVFSTPEMNKLKTTDIGSVRFNIRGNAKKFSSQTGNFTAVNKKAYFSTKTNKPEQHQTAQAITEL